MFRNFIKYALHPLILTCVMTTWVLNPEALIVYPLALFGVQATLGTLEHWLPARPDWVVHARDKIINIVLVLFLVAGAVAVAELYSVYLVDPLAKFRTSLGLEVWPHEWPLLVQVFMVFFIAEFVWYWIHRAEHRWYPVWRLSGHGAHHSFKRLNALNFGLNHPLELFFLAIPAALVELVFGVGLAAAGAAMLLATQASIAHTNLELNSKWIDLLLTTNRHHIRHHSAVLEESNTNYGCATLLWDRVFGTFVNSSVIDCGIGPTEPTLKQKLMMPIREPAGTVIAPT